MRKIANSKILDIEKVFDWAVKENYSDLLDFENKKSNIKYIKFFSKENKIRNYNYCKKFANQALGKFLSNLNKYHETNFSKKYWEIIVYQWYILNLNLIYDYWILSDLLIKNKIYKIYNIDNQLLEYEKTVDCNSQSKHYHYWILSEIIKYKRKFQYIEKKYVIKTNQNKKKKFSIVDNLFKYLMKFVLIFSSPKIFIRDLGIKKKYILLLNLRLKQFPSIWIEPHYKSNKINVEKREKYFYKKKKIKNFNNFLNSIIYKTIPKSFLEDFDNINLSVKSFWPKNVKTILTAGFRQSDIFRIWIANMKRKRSKIYMFQHGGFIGMSMFHDGEESESYLVDKFFTWGFKNNKKNLFPLFSLGLSTKKINKNLNGKENKIIFCISSNTKYLCQVPGFFPRNNIQRIKKIFIIKQTLAKLKKEIKEKVIIRYDHKSYSRNKILINKKLFGEEFIFDNCATQLTNHLNNTRLVVHDCCSTGWLETIFFNIPTVIILDKKVEVFRKGFNKNLNELIKCKVIHYSHDSLIEFINNNYHEIDNWWNSNLVKKSIHSLQKEYIKGSNDPINDLIKTLRK